MKTVQICEYDSLIAGSENGLHKDGYVTLKRDAFELLERFLLTEQGKEDAPELMHISRRRGVGDVVTAKNYVGLIALKDGTAIEILPKVHSQDDPDGIKAKKLVLDMLRTLPDFPSRTAQVAGVDLSRLDIFEIFIRMFLDEVYGIAKRGLKCGYEAVEENSARFKGKLIFSQQMRRNLLHKERSYIRYDVFTVNRPENRILKAALELLFRRTRSHHSRTDIKNLLQSFAEVETSSNFRGDFQKCSKDRTVKDYAAALQWSRVFLTGESFTNYAGSEDAFALLFPMERLFESYIAAQLKRHLDSSVYTVTAQEGSRWLFDEPKSFSMRPDLVIRKGGEVFILDTKWKILNPDKPNGGISQADMYQMCAYQRKWGARHTTLIYPKPAYSTDAIPKSYFADDGTQIHLWFVDLLDLEESIRELETTF